jgi:hypothetical protein
VQRLITAVYPLEEFTGAFAAALSGAEIKVHVKGQGVRP